MASRSKLTSADVERHAELLTNRLRKRARHLAGRFRKAGVEVYRLYDWDIPEVRATVDWYAGHLVAAEYTRTQTDGVEDWLGQVMAPAAAALGVPKENLHLKRRRTGGRGQRYARLDRAGRRLDVREGDLRFWVNLDDYIDTGLFADHRITRRMVGERSEGRAVLNLFAYTGSFTCYAAKAGADRTCTVDVSGRYLDWARDNLELNGLTDPRHRFVRADAWDFLAGGDDQFDLAVVDPPSFSTGGPEQPDFDVQRDHPELLEAVIRRMKRGGQIYFSSNHQRFEPDLEGLRVRSVEEITARTVPEDYRNQHVHRCFLIEV